MTKKTFERYRKLIQTRTWKEQDIISFRSMLRANVRNPSVAWDGETNAQKALYLLTRFKERAPYRITREQTVKGLDWLKRSCFKVNGDIRNSKSRPFDTWECEVIARIMKRFSHWTFDDVTDVSGGDRWPVYMPQYTMRSKDGIEFTYVPGSQGTVYYSTAA